MADVTHGSLVQRMIGAAMLNVATYEEVEADRSATGQAATVVAIVAVASAIGAWNAGIGAVIGGLIAAFVGWLIWSGITYFVGTRLFGGTADWGELLRTIGFAQSPGVLNVLGIIPFLGGLVGFAVAIWVLVAGVIAIRQALDIDTGKAVLTAIVSWIPLFLLQLFIGGAALLGGAIAG
ncbi:MAG TPA: YIP1 family protein [Longimicrobiaceae bacterium]|jgi:hypothetical protein